MCLAWSGCGISSWRKAATKSASKWRDEQAERYRLANSACGRTDKTALPLAAKMRGYGVLPYMA